MRDERQMHGSQTDSDSDERSGGMSHWNLTIVSVSKKENHLTYRNQETPNNRATMHKLI